MKQQFVFRVTNVLFVSFIFYTDKGKEKKWNWRKKNMQRKLGLFFYSLSDEWNSISHNPLHHKQEERSLAGVHSDPS